MAKSNSNSSRTSSNSNSNRAKPMIPKADFTKTRREYRNGGRCK